MLLGGDGLGIWMQMFWVQVLSIISFLSKKTYYSLTLVIIIIILSNMIMDIKRSINQ